MKLQKKDVILFNGDSVTDCRRDRGDFHSLSGYSETIMNCLNSFYPSLEIVGFNRGVGGDSTKDLLCRLENEFKETKATVFSVLIGVNDTWHRYDGRNCYVSADQFEENYDAILKIAKKYARETVIMEPFLLPTDPDKSRFREDLDPKIQIVRSLARKYGTDFIPLDGIFAEKCVSADSEIFSVDGVHPTDTGRAVIAKEWLKRVRLSD